MKYSEIQQKNMKIYENLTKICDCLMKINDFGVIFDETTCFLTNNDENQQFYLFQDHFFHIFYHFRVPKQPQDIKIPEKTSLFAFFVIENQKKTESTVRFDTGEVRFL